MLAAVIRHQLTDYDSLITNAGLTREEALCIVQPEIDDWLTAWSVPSA